MSWKSNIGSVVQGLDPVVHEVCHNKKMYDLCQEETVPNVLWHEAGCPLPIVGVQFGVCEDPEDDGQDSGDGLGSDEM